MHAMPRHSISITQLVSFSFNLPDLHLKRLAVLFYTISSSLDENLMSPSAIFLKCCYKGSLFPVIPFIFSLFSILFRMLSSCCTAWYARCRAMPQPTCGCPSPVPAHRRFVSSPYRLAQAKRQQPTVFHRTPTHPP